MYLFLILEHMKSLLYSVVLLTLVGFGCTPTAAPVPTNTVPDNTKNMQDEMMKDETKMMGEPESMMDDKTDTEMKENMKDTTMMDTTDTSMNTPGSYGVYSAEKIALAADHNVVLFFHAPWCPYCRALNEDIEKNLNAIPHNLSILKTDYDTEVALKKKYGVTYQHTLVQIDKDGNMIQKWSGSPTLAEFVTHLK